MVAKKKKNLPAPEEENIASNPAIIAVILSSTATNSLIAR